MRNVVRWAKGGQAAIVSMANETVVLRSTVPSPPGSRIEGLVAGEPPMTVRVKVHACRREAEGEFVLDGRLLDLTRETRERLVAIVPSPGAA